MTQSQFRSLEISMNNTLIAARQNYVAAQKAHTEAEALCTCTGRRCAPDCPAEIAWIAMQNAGKARLERENARLAFYAAL